MGLGEGATVGIGWTRKIVDAIHALHCWMIDGACVGTAVGVGGRGVGVAGMAVGAIVARIVGTAVDVGVIVVRGVGVSVGAVVARRVGLDIGVGVAGIAVGDSLEACCTHLSAYVGVGG